MLQVTFVDDPIRKDGSVMSRVVQRRNVPFEEVLTYMSKGAVASEIDMSGVMAQFSEALVHFLSKGDRVQTPMGAFTLALIRSGDSSQRTVANGLPVIRLRPTTAVSDSLKAQLEVTVVDTPPALAPLVYEVTNKDDKKASNAAKAGEILHLTGARLSFDEEDLNLGVFFVAKDGVATRATVYSRVGTIFIDCKVPQVDKGDYTLEVRTQPAKTLRTGAYKTPISVS